MADRRHWFLLLAFTALALAACGPDDGDQNLSHEVASRGGTITHGTPYSGHPSVGYLLVPKGGAMSLCTATLVGKQTVLTAAHCIPPGTPVTFVLGSQHYKAAKTIQHTSWNTSSLANDIGLVILQSPPANVTPSLVTKTAPNTGLKILLIGYGITTTYGKDSGVKRMAYNYIQKVYSTRFSFSGSGGGVGNTCQGDSGGPAFATVGGREEQVGITSAGADPCGSTSLDTRVDVYYSWLVANSAGDLYAGPQKQDTQNPKITITSPATGTKLIGAFSLKASASDDIGVASVEVLVDGKVTAKRSTTPWEFSLHLQAGKHTIKAVARDKKNKTGQDQISVEVLPTLGFGSLCGANKHCASGMCARDSKTGKKYCTKKCTPGGEVCGGGALCVPAGTNVFVCGPVALPPDEESIEGSCSVGASGHLPLGGMLLLLLVLVLVVRRRP